MDTESTPERSTLAVALSELRTTGVIDEVALQGFLVEATVTAYRRVVVDDESVSADVDIATGRCQLFTVDLDGSRVELGAPNSEVTRQSVRLVRAAVAGRLRESDKDRIIDEALRRRGELADATVESLQGRVWLLRAGDTMALLPPEEQMQGEVLRLHQHLKVVVIDGRRRAEDAVLVVSRSHPLLLRLLMAQEIPELESGQVVIRAIAREAGRRSKIAVIAPDGDVDPQGACIGPRGVRHRAIVSELGQEQVQVLTWTDDPAVYVARALAPATVQTVTLDLESHTATVLVSSDQLSLAIGRGGENARLAARLTGWRIDIHDGSRQPALDDEEPVAAVDGLDSGEPR